MHVTDYDLGTDFVPSDVKFVDWETWMLFTDDECLRRKGCSGDDSGKWCDSCCSSGDHCCDPVLEVRGLEPFSVIQIDTHLDFVDP